MTSCIFDLTIPAQSQVAESLFALSLYRPPFAKSKLAKDTEKQISLKEVTKQLKKIRTNVTIATEETKPLQLFLSLVTSSLIDTKAEVSVSAKKGAMQWEQFTLVANLKQVEALPEKKQQQLIQSAANLGHFHSKPFNTLSAVQFCRDENYLATGEFGFTENQLDNQTASLSISGGSNAFSAFYAILITRINGISMAQHLIGTTPIAITIQAFFQRVMQNENFTALQNTIQQALTKTASDINDALHIMDKQITLPIPNENGQCDYINITPIINPTVFAATSRCIFYVKEQSIHFMNIELGGANPSNAGTAVGEVTGQNSRLKMVFPKSNIARIKQIITSLNKQKRCLWSRGLKQKVSNNLKQYAHNTDISNEKKRQILKDTVQIALEELQTQVNDVAIYLHLLSEADANKILYKDYYAFFSSSKRNAKHYDIWLKTVIRNFETLPKIKDTINYQPIIAEIKQQFKDLYRNGGL